MAVPAFFENNDYFIDEKVAFLKFTNTYRVYSPNGEQIGTIQETMHGILKVLSLFINKSFFPFKLDVLDTTGRVLAMIKRGWTFFMSKIQVLDETGAVIAHIRQQFKFFKPTFHILDTNEQPIASISGDWKAWNFAITSNEGKQIGTITKKWNGILKEAFTTADKYIVSIDKDIAEDDGKTAIVATAITIDMVLKESK
ncbi:MAG: hypothetical protein LBJ31_00575 [Treponema sp.]|jgi:uncharacterized protein YxjI|nr:hypothetical protein [Treponema sp.]